MPARTYPRITGCRSRQASMRLVIAPTKTYAKSRQNVGLAATGVQRSPLPVKVAAAASYLLVFVAISARGASLSGVCSTRSAVRG
jgi:hypothetical protein